MFVLRKLFWNFGVSSQWAVPEVFSWNEKTYDEMIEKVATTKPENIVEKLNILVIGPQGHGKSSFINSLASLSVGEKSSVCNAGGGREGDGKNLTVKYREFDLPGKFKYFRLYDVRGLTKKQAEAYYLHNDLKACVEGRMKHGYTFRNEASLQEGDKYFRSEETGKKKVHGVIIVLDIQEVYDIHMDYQKAIRDFTSYLNEINVPVSVILTKADDLNPGLRRNIENIYKCNEVITAAEKVHSNFGIPRQNIFPVVNFHDQIRFGWQNGLPLLIAMKSCLAAARDHLYNQEKENSLPEKGN